MEIAIEGLTKTYNPKRGKYKKDGPRDALKGVDLTIGQGTFGLLGPNGAGKTTFMRILATLLAPTSGKILVDGEDLTQNHDKVRSVLGYLPQDFHGFPNLKVKEFLHYAGVMRGMLSTKQRKEMVNVVLESTGLTEVRGRRLKKLSGGMLRRVGIAQAIMGPPGLLIIDEPTVGLDPEERIRLRTELSKIGIDCTIILSTHIVGDISSSCENIAVLDTGQIMFQGSPSQLIANAKEKVWEFTISEQEYDAVKDQYTIVRTIASPGSLQLRIVGDRPQREGAEAIPPTLEDAYMYLMKDRHKDDLDSILDEGDDQ
jgi:ABC-type multidrug transport system ATPase subunit